MYSHILSNTENCSESFVVCSRNRAYDMTSKSVMNFNILFLFDVLSDQETVNYEGPQKL